MKIIVTLTAVAFAATANATVEDSATIGGMINEVSVVGFKQDRAAISPVSQQGANATSKTTNLWVFATLVAC